MFAAFGDSGELVHIPVNPSDFEGVSAAINLAAPRINPLDAKKIANCIEQSAVPVFSADVTEKESWKKAILEIVSQTSPDYYISNRAISVFLRKKPKIAKANWQYIWLTCKAVKLKSR